MSAVQPPPPNLPKRGALGSYRPLPKIQRTPIPATIPTCCGQHRLKVLDHLSYLYACDAFAHIEGSVAAGFNASDVNEIVDRYVAYMTARLRNDAETGKAMWQANQMMVRCGVCGAEVSHGRCWGCGG